jgi:hypothetical protein
MNAPSRHKTGLAKVTAFLLTTLLVGLGLCGANYVGFFTSGLLSGSVGNVLASALLVLGVVEAAIIGLSIAGLVVVAAVMVIRDIVLRVQSKK